MNLDQPTGNLALDSLPPDERSALAPFATLSRIVCKQVVREQDAPVDSLFFPVDSVLSLISTALDDEAIEVGVVGSEGVVGVQYIVEADHAVTNAVCQATGDLITIGLDAIRERAAIMPALRTVAMRNMELQLRMATRTAACNRFHSIIQRAARWLLLMDDRTQSSQFDLTHELLAIMLGARRAGVSEAASYFQSRGLISYTYRRIRIIDRAGLAAEACVCYAASLRDTIALTGFVERNHDAEKLETVS